MADTVQIVLPDGSYCGARTKYASADTVAVLRDHAQPIPAHVELGPVDLGFRRHPHRAVVEHADVDRQRHRCGDPFDAERGPQIGGVAGGGLDGGHHDADLREALGVEEIGRSQMLVAFTDAGAQRRHLDVEAAEDGALAGDLAVAV